MLRRLRIVAAALPFAALLFFAPSALAVLTTSTVTTSSNPFYVPGVSPSSIHVSISSDGNSGEQADLNCYYGTGTPSPRVAIGTVTLSTGGAFSGDVPSTTLVTPTACVLRAVPHGDMSDQPPGTPSSFKGPTVGLGGLTPTMGTGSNTGELVDYYAARGQLQGGADYDSAGSCGLDDSYVFDPTTLAETNALFYCDDYLWFRDGRSGPNPPTETAATRAELRVDGVNAYLPGVASQLFTGAKGEPGLSGMTTSFSTDPATGDTTITETEGALFCAPNAAAFPATSANCSSFVPAGVGLARSIVQNHAGRVVRIDDRWFGDGHPHLLDLELEQDVFASKFDGAFEFPWVSSAFAQHNPGDTIPGAPSAPGSIFVKGSASTPSGGDPLNAQGAITFASPPDGARFIEAGHDTVPTFVLNYVRPIPAGGNLFMSFTYSDAFALSEVQSDATAAQSLYTAPSVAITSPPNGSTSNHTPTTISGTVGGGQPVGQVVVNGVVATLGVGGTWSAQVPLALGANTVTAVASTVYGATSQTQETVNLVPPSGPGATLSLSGAIKRILNGIRFKLTCLFATCHGYAVLTTVEKVKGGKVISARRRQKVKKRTVVVGRVNFTISAGQTKTITLTLNATGRKLLKRFHKLPVTFKVILIGADGKPIVIKSKKLTLKPQKKKKKHKR